jgi:ferredoxin
MIESIDYRKCTGCGTCVEVCPLDTLRLDAFTRNVPPCRMACPAGVKIREYIFLLKLGRVDEAIALIREALPFPAITGRICFHPCESKCARKDVDESVNINALERFIGDRLLDEKGAAMPRLHASEAAIVGSGPAGLSAGYFLNRLGYKVTIYESSSQVGGTLRTRSPEKRLPRDVLDAQIRYISDMGVQFVLNSSLGERLTIDDLRGKGYKAILLATGSKPEDKAVPRGGVVLSPADPLHVDPVTLQTNMSDVFVSGSLAIGRSPLVKMIAHAGRAVRSIDRYLRGEDLNLQREKKRARAGKLPGEGIGKQERHITRDGFTLDAAMDEARRCMSCGGKAYIAYPDDCMTCFECEVECPSTAIGVHPFKEALPPTIEYSRSP